MKLKFVIGELVLLAIAATIIVLAFPRDSWKPRPRVRALLDRIARERDGATRGERVAWLAILGVALVDRLVHLTQTMRGDESLTFLRYASQPLSEALSDYTYPNNHLFHTLLVWISTRVFGNSPAAIRLPAFVAGLLIVPAVYALARRFADRATSLLAMGLAAVWPALILFSTNARGYSIMWLAFIVLVVVADEAIDRESSWPWLTLAALIAVGMFTAPVMLYPGGGVMLWMVVEKARRAGTPAARRMLPRVVATTVLAATLSVMLMLPILLHGVTRVASNKYVRSDTLREFAATVRPFGADLVRVHSLGIPAPLLLLLVLALVAALIVPSAERSRRARLLGTLMLWNVAVLVATRRSPPGRVWLYLLPVACVYIALGIRLAVARLARAHAPNERALLYATMAALVVVIGGDALRTRAIFRSRETGTLAGAPRIADYLVSRLRPGDELVVVSPGVLTLDYYLWRHGVRRLDFNDRAARQRVFVVVDPRNRQTLAGVQARAPGVRWSELVPDGAPVSFEPESVFVFRYLSGS